VRSKADEMASLVYCIAHDTETKIRKS